MVMLQAIAESTALSSQSQDNSQSSGNSDVDIAVIQCLARQEKTRISNYVDAIVTGYAEKEFSSHFRLSRETFDSLLGN
jgi:hypothetical protein